jgi:hypothetical protein
MSVSRVIHLKERSKGVFELYGNGHAGNGRPMLYRRGTYEECLEKSKELPEFSLLDHTKVPDQIARIRIRERDGRILIAYTHGSKKELPLPSVLPRGLSPEPFIINSLCQIIVDMDARIKALEEREQYPL